MDLRMRISSAILITALTLSPLAMGQKLELKLDDIAAKASKKNEVDLDGPLLKMALANLPDLATKFAKAKNSKAAKESQEPPVEVKLPALLNALTGVYVRNYGFDAAGAYEESDLDAIRNQVGNGSGWMRIVMMLCSICSSDVPANRACGVRLKCTRISVIWRGSVLPVRTKTGTPAHRQLSM